MVPCICMDRLMPGVEPDDQPASIGDVNVTPLSNSKKNGKPIGGLGNAKARRHSNMTCEEAPPPARETRAAGRQRESL